MNNMLLTGQRAEVLSFHGQAIENGWQLVSEQFLERVSATQKAAARQLLYSRHCGGVGLRDWVSAIAHRGSLLPESIPPQVLQVYLTDSEAVPLFDCEECGLAIPVRPNRVHGMESEPEHQYFPICPLCNGRTGPYYFWSRQLTSSAGGARRPKPR